MMSIVPVWTLILGAGVFFYVVLDGFDLGIGILYGFAKTRADRQTMKNAIAPIWDGNETWLVLGGTGLLAAFPLAFAIILPAVYFPILVMLLALVFRGVAFEFQFRDAEHRHAWDYAFSIGSGLATFAQGIVLGAFIQGFQVEGRAFSGGAFDCFTPFSLFTGLALMCGYALLGACWLILKTEGALLEKSRRWARQAFLATFAAVFIVSIWTPFIDADIARRWFSMPNILFLSPVPLATALVGFLWWRAVAKKQEVAPFLYAILLFSLSYLGIAISLFPMIVPHHFSLEQAASDPSTQIFLGLGTLFLLPIIIVYTGWSYWVFRGKVRADIGYH
ncbi:MAG TPA: cytochrome d ubiquinol oxidase subunit II [Rhizomicrobium sp.]|nr:cytochrome d ubiquinol oxidase subunit II [Rhizomicrobium sp.]